MYGSPADPVTRDQMADEARRIVAAAASRGAAVRLVGGLAVHALTASQGGGRDYRDIDLVVRRRHLKALAAVLADFGYEENIHMRFASGGGLLQFYRPCLHGRGEHRAHIDDRVDVYADTYRHHHEIPLARRLTIEPLTVSAADALIVKLQRADANDDDLGDVVRLLLTASLERNQRPNAIDMRRVSALCARDWGLQRDVLANLHRVPGAAGRLRLDRRQSVRLEAAVRTLEGEIRAARKSPRWRLRALVGERWPWREAVDERDGQRIGLREAPPRGQAAA
jgi:GrpB-like predicted nucleotidyltransferase (UPF0157 family)